MKKFLRDPRWRALLAALAVVALLASGGAAVVSIEHGSPAPVGTPSPPAAPAPPAGRTDLGSDLRAETGISASDRARNDAIGQRLTPPPEGARATRGPTCRVDYSDHVYSDRAPGVVPDEFHLHYTVSHNVPGWSDVYAIRDYFARTRLGSAHFIVDFEGHCLKMVPGEMKAWTAGNANSYAYSVEIIAYGDEPASAWKASPLFKHQVLARLARSVMAAHGIPIRWVDPIGCVFPAGWTDHNHLECGNDHHDVSPHFPFRLFRRQLLAVH